MKKVLVWDCDDTLWDGTLIEGSVSLPNGRFAMCQELYNRGVVQTTASYNLLEDVEKQLHAFGLSNFFVVPMASLEVKKPDMITAIKETLNISKYSDIVFVDDNIHNLLEVRATLPDVVAVTVHDLDVVLDKYFTKDEYTDADRDRVRMYKSEVARQEMGKAYTDNRLDFLRSLNMKAKISVPTEEQMPRVCQLVERANRLAAANTTYTKEILQHIQQDLLVLEAEDDFGSYGLSGVAYVDNRIVKLLVISCRLQGKGLGSTFLGYIINMEEGPLQAIWKPTEYNAGIDSLYSWYGAVILPAGDGGELRVAIIENKTVELPDWVEVIDGN